MVLNNWHGAETNESGFLTDASKNAILERMNVIEKDLPSDAPRPRMGPLTCQYLANREHMVAQDQAIRSVTSCSGLKHFQAERLAGRLSEGEVRYKVPFSELPPEVQAVSVGMAFRYCIYDAESDNTCLEVPWGSPMPSIWSCVDGGADQWQQKLKQYYKYNIRGSERYDPAHRTTRCRERAIIASQGTWIKNEFGICLAYVRGPWSSESNHQLIINGGKEIFKNFKSDMPLFKHHIYERYTRAKNKQRLPPAFGTREHREQMWAECREDRLFQSLSEDYSPNRWKCWTDRMEYYSEGSFDALLFVCCYILITRGVLRNIGQDFPALNGLVKWLDVVKDGVPVPGEMSELDIKSLKESSKELQAKKTKGCASLLIVAESLSNPVTRRLGYVTTQVPKVLEDELMEDLTQCSTAMGRSEWRISQACGDPDEKIRVLLRMTEDWNFLQQAGFLLPEDVVGPDSLREDFAVASYTWDLVRNSIVQKITTQSFYTDRPPYMFLCSRPF